MSTVSSVKHESGVKRGNCLVLVATASWTDPITSPAIAPSICLLLSRIECVSSPAHSDGAPPSSESLRLRAVETEIFFLLRPSPWSSLSLMVAKRPSLAAIGNVAGCTFVVCWMPVGRRFVAPPLSVRGCFVVGSLWDQRQGTAQAPVDSCSTFTSIREAKTSTVPLQLLVCFPGRHRTQPRDQMRYEPPI